MRMFKLFGEGTRHLTRGSAIAYRIYRGDVKDYNEDRIVRKRLNAVSRFEQAKTDGLNVAQAAAAVGVPQATLYRWRALYRKYGAVGLKNGSRARHHPPPRTARTPEVIEAITALREVSPWCKEIIAEYLRHKEFFVSASTVGRVLRDLLDKGIISRSGAGKWFATKHRRKWLWAQRRRQKPIITAPGEVVQIDHMKVHLGAGVRVIVFAATDLSSKAISCMAASRPTAASATRFLQQLTEDFPFPIRQLQVDGGSEFRAEFELSCQQRGIPLFVIPPRSPKHNSEIENRNGTIRREVFNFRDDIVASVSSVQDALRLFCERFNTLRPNLALSYRDNQGKLRYRTPFEYISLFLPEVAF